MVRPSRRKFIESRRDLSKNPDGVNDYEGRTK